MGAHAILLSQDNGNSFTNVSGADLPGTVRSFQFVLPSPVANQVQARIRVAAKDAPNGNRLATGDSPSFTLQKVPTYCLLAIDSVIMVEAGDMSRPAPEIRLSTAEKEILLRWMRSSKTEQRMVERARMILLASDGLSGKEIALKRGAGKQVAPAICSRQNCWP